MGDRERVYYNKHADVCSKGPMRLDVIHFQSAPSGPEKKHSRGQQQ